MTERHHYKYVVLDSSKENGNAVQAKFNVQIPHGITNASRVCVKSFSMPNVIHNVYGDFKTVRFVEFYRPTAGGNWVYDLTVSPLTSGSYDHEDEPNNNREAGTMVGIRNYGVLNVSGPRKERVLTMTVKDAEGNSLWTRSIDARNGYVLK